jgi:SAM-dependent methyltransferase
MEKTYREQISRAGNSSQALSRFEDVRLARGYFEDIRSQQDGLFLKGWMLVPDGEFTCLRGYVNGALAGTAEMTARKDLSEAFTWIPHAGRSGFQICLRTTALQKLDRIELIGFVGDRPAARMSTLHRADLDQTVPTPPIRLLERMGSRGSARYHLITGLKIFGDLHEAIHRHARTPIARLLDWGCGCGRVTTHFLLVSDFKEVHGCDVDGEAVAWCGANLRSGSFKRVEPWPPTPYADVSFDVVVGVSVFTHFIPELQAAWLSELRRIVRPGGLVLASVMGESATRFQFGGDASVLGKREFNCDIESPSLNGITPKGYYRDVYQARAYTVREWSKYFDVLEYLEQGVANHQDLVVMRRPLDKQGET